MAINKAKLAAGLLGLGAGEGDLKKLKIEYETGKKGPDRYDTIEALFNPSEIGISRSIEWKQQRAAGQGPWSGIAYQAFRASNPQSLAIELFFDTYEARSSPSLLGSVVSALKPTLPFGNAPEATNVKALTDQVALLAQVNQELHRPPHCKLSWGKFHIFSGVLTSINTNFTMFMPNGMPVRARVSCSFIEHVSVAFAVRRRELHSADVAKTRTVRRNDTLQSLAAEEYNDATQWRLIAKANGIVNPRDLQPGMVLMIPKLQP